MGNWGDEMVQLAKVLTAKLNNLSLTWKLSSDFYSYTTGRPYTRALAHTHTHPRSGA